MTDLDLLAKLLAGLGHPTRLRIAALLYDRPTSPVQAAKRIDGIRLGAVAHHFRMLDRAGLVRLVKTRPRRGATEHFYELTGDGRQLLETLRLPSR